MKNRGYFAVLLFILFVSQAGAAVGTVFTYQGRLTGGLEPLNGLYNFNFRLYTAPTNGTEVGLNARSAPVTNGVFTASLDFGSAAFDGNDRWLEVQVATNGGGFTTLQPRQLLGSAPYSIYAGLAANVSAGAIGSAQLANTISLGATNAVGRLDVYRTAANTPAITLLGSSSQVRTFGDTGLEGSRMEATTLGGRLTAWDRLGNLAAFLGSSSTNAGGFAQLYQANGNLGLVLDGDATDASGGGQVGLRASDGTAGAVLRGTASMSLYGNSHETMRLENVPAAGGLLTMRDEAGRDTVFVGSSASAGGYVEAVQANGLVGALVDGDATGASGGGQVTVYRSDGAAAALLTANAFGTGGGGVIVRNTNGANRVYLSGQANGGGGSLAVFAGNGNNTALLLGSQSPTLGAEMDLKQFNGTTTILLDAENTANAGGLVRVFKGDGSVGVTLQGADVNGDSRVTAQVVQITGGADLSEQFDVDAESRLKPGTVVCIDTEHPGRLVISSRPYDHTVAGIISGAGGVKTGMLMGQKGTAADGRHPVALSGRVYCAGDASNGAIRPGDLLTTSPHAGCAMKATDPAKSHGAVIGKAMSSLEAGEGLVLVLVTLE